MKNIFTYMVAAICLVLFLSSCSILPNETEGEGSTTTSLTQEEDNVVIYDNYFDTNCEERPTPEAVADICEGMEIDNIIERIGKPHDVGPFSGIPSLEWKMADGSHCCIVFSISQDAPSNISAIERLMQYGIAFRIIVTEA